ncbi:hypothetical protein GCM10027291_03000 [Telluribacter humicola]
MSDYYFRYFSLYIHRVDVSPEPTLFGRRVTWIIHSELSDVSGQDLLDTIGQPQSFYFIGLTSHVQVVGTDITGNGSIVSQTKR